MDWEDPEQRIRDLERQLAGGSSGSVLAPGNGLTPEQVHNVGFSKPPIGRRGYHEDEVDAFLDRVEAALRDQQG